MNYCSGEREKKINNEKIVTVKVMLNLNGRGDDLKECRTQSDQVRRGAVQVQSHTVSLP